MKSKLRAYFLPAFVFLRPIREGGLEKSTYTLCSIMEKIPRRQAPEKKGGKAG